MSKRSYGGSNGADKFILEMPREYADHVLCKRVRLLAEEDALRDTAVIFRTTGNSVPVNSYFLSMMSPVFQAMICGAFKESIVSQNQRTLEIDEVEAGMLEAILDLACGKSVQTRDLNTILELAKVADRFQMTDVVALLEDFMVKHVTLKSCVEMLSVSAECGLGCLGKRCHDLMLSNFEMFCKTEAFKKLSENDLDLLLDSDMLKVSSEERVFEAVVTWMKAGGTELRGLQLVLKIRFLTMDEDYLENVVPATIPQSELLTALLTETAAIKSAVMGPSSSERLLCSKAADPRRSIGVTWDRVRFKRIQRSMWSVNALVKCKGRVCGNDSGGIAVWDSKTGVYLGELSPRHENRSISTLAVMSGRLVSGHHDGSLRLWDLDAGQSEVLVKAHEKEIRAMVVIGQQVVTCSDDTTVKIWGVSSDGQTWKLESTLEHHDLEVNCLAAFGTWVASGSDDRTACVWELPSGRFTTQLEVRSSVLALAAQGRFLFTASVEGKIKSWAVGTWHQLSSVEPFPPKNLKIKRRYCERIIPSCLAVCGSHLISGVRYSGPEPMLEESLVRYKDIQDDQKGVRYAVQVWDMATLSQLYGVPQSKRRVVRVVAAFGKVVWAGLDNGIVTIDRRQNDGSEEEEVSSEFEDETTSEDSD